MDQTIKDTKNYYPIFNNITPSMSKILEGIKKADKLNMPKTKQKLVELAIKEYNKSFIESNENKKDNLYNQI